VVGLLLCMSPLSMAAAPQELTYSILREVTHDPHLFTQGLILQENHLVESSGGYGQSIIRRYKPGNGAILNQARFPAKVFAEGIAQVRDQLFVLTWREGTSFRLDAESLELRETYTFHGEGWGLTFDGRELIMSDGSDRLIRRDPDNFSILGSLRVQSGEKRWSNLNELEYAGGYIWANIWLDNRIIAIDPRTGAVKGILDLSPLVALNSTQPRHSVLNGIAYDPALDAFWITGKLWPRLYLIKVKWPSSDKPG
jgi:glutamine cyclotransferase